MALKPPALFLVFSIALVFPALAQPKKPITHIDASAKDVLAHFKQADSPVPLSNSRWMGFVYGSDEGAPFTLYEQVKYLEFKVESELKNIARDGTPEITYRVHLIQESPAGPRAVELIPDPKFHEYKGERSLPGFPASRDTWTVRAGKNSKGTYLAVQNLVEMTKGKASIETIGLFYPDPGGRKQAN